MNIALNFDKRNVFITLLVLLLLIGGFYHFNTVSKHNDKITQEKNLQHALTDSIKTYKNEKNQWVSEKLTIQAETKELKDKNLTLTSNQSELVRRVDEIGKHNQIISAALIQMGVKLDGLKNNSSVIETDSTEKFTSSPKDTTINYEILVKNVKRYNSAFKPVLEFTKFTLPNKQLVEFHWQNDRKEGYPVSFTVTNSNPYYHVYNLDSYIIPEITKANVKPTFLQKIGKFSKSTGGKIVFIGIGFIGGVILYK